MNIDSLESQIQRYDERIRELRQKFLSMVAEADSSEKQYMLTDWADGVERAITLLHIYTEGAYGMSLEQIRAATVTAQLATATHGPSRADQEDS